MEEVFGMVNKDKYIVERLGHCWHEFGVSWEYMPTLVVKKCKKCCILFNDNYDNPNFATPNGFFLLWDKIMEDDDLWCELHTHLWYNDLGIHGDYLTYVHYEIINPIRFRDAVYDFFLGQDDERNSPS